MIVNDAESRDVVKCEQKIANIGERENPTENPDNTNPNIGALHCFGMTSDNEDSAIAIQLIKPLLVPTT